MGVLPSREEAVKEIYSVQIRGCACFGSGVGDSKQEGFAFSSLMGSGEGTAQASGLLSVLPVWKEGARG